MYSCKPGKSASLFCKFNLIELMCAGHLIAGSLHINSVKAVSLRDCIRCYCGSTASQSVPHYCYLIHLQVVEDMDQVPYICRCIGFSGACTLQTCQYELPEFGVLANRIRDFYFKNHTCQVEWNHIIGEHSAYVPVNPQDDCDNYLRFTQNSPDYCAQNDALGSPGTAGRECDPHSDGPNSCNYLCTQCGRNHRHINEETEDDCWCEFVFCCEIRCRRCPVNRQYHICT